MSDVSVADLFLSQSSPVVVNRNFCLDKRLFTVVVVDRVQLACLTMIGSVFFFSPPLASGHSFKIQCVICGYMLIHQNHSGRICSRLFICIPTTCTEIKG